VVGGFTSAGVRSAGILGVVTTRLANMPPLTHARPVTPLSEASSRAKTGSGATPPMSSSRGPGLHRQSITPPINPYQDRPGVSLPIGGTSCIETTDLSGLARGWISCHQKKQFVRSLPPTPKVNQTGSTTSCRRLRRLRPHPARPRTAGCEGRQPKAPVDLQRRSPVRSPSPWARDSHSLNRAIATSSQR